MNRILAKAHEIAARHRSEHYSAAMRVGKLFAKASEERGSLYVYEVIGEDWWTGGGVTAKKVVEALDALKGVKTLDIFINSEGGDVFEAKAIYANLKRFDAELVVHVDGIAASAATFIAMAGDRIITAPAATWMVHEAWSFAMGRAADMRAMADVLDLENRALAETYAARTKKNVEEMLDVMAKETWMSAKDALERGFTDEISPTEESSKADEQGTAARASPLIAAAARTQERIRTVATRDAAVVRHSRRIQELSSRASPGKRNGQP